MKVVCAWCRRFLRGVKNSRDVSHGICHSCAVREFSAFVPAENLGLFLDEPQQPWGEWRDTGGEG